MSAEKAETQRSKPGSGLDRRDVLLGKPKFGSECSFCQIVIDPKFTKDMGERVGVADLAALAVK